MSTYGNAVESAVSPSAPPGPNLPPGPPQVDMLASAEMQAWLRRLQAEDRNLGKRNRYLTLTLAVAVVLLAAALGWIHQATIGSYAEIDELHVVQSPTQPGRLQLSYRVLAPGRVFCRRTSGPLSTDVVDRFHGPCEVDRPWSWGYQPGEPIQFKLWYRRGLFWRSYSESFPTPDCADIVILIDTTGSMDPSIAALKEKCMAFSQKLRSQSLRHRFALLGFGDTNEGPWLDEHGFTDDVDQLRGWVEHIQRFDGGDIPESALDALEAALNLPFDDNALRCFYLVSDADFHDPTHTGATTADVAARLAAKHVLLRVFSLPEYEAAYKPLLGDGGRFDEIENFGKALSEARLLED